MYDADDLDLSDAAVDRRYADHCWAAEPLTDEHDPIAWRAAIRHERYRPTDFGD